MAPIPHGPYVPNPETSQGVSPVPSPLPSWLCHAALLHILPPWAPAPRPPGHKWQGTDTFHALSGHLISTVIVPRSAQATRKRSSGKRGAICSPGTHRAWVKPQHGGSPSPGSLPAHPPPSATLWLPSACSSHPLPACSASGPCTRVEHQLARPPPLLLPGCCFPGAERADISLATATRATSRWLHGGSEQTHGSPP